MRFQKSFLLTGLIVVAIFLQSCTAAVIEPNVSVDEPVPTSDIDATVQSILQSTSDEWTATPSNQASQDESTPVPATPSPTRTPSLTPTPTSTLAVLDFELPVNVGPFSYPNDVNPLTGLKLSDPSLLERRPLAVKITNYPRRVRPQSGLMIADQVFEYYIEVGLTRFIAVFYGNDGDRVGPVRSGRFFDEHVVRMYNAIFAFASADRRVLDAWIETDLVTRLVLPRPGNCPPLCRDENNPDYNNLYTNTAQLGPYAQFTGSDNDRYELGGVRFQSLTPWGGRAMEKVFVRYSRLDYNHWLYNAESGLYDRYQDIADDTGSGEQYAPLFDEYTDGPVSAANVIVLLVPHEEFVKSSDTEVIKINLFGAGVGYAFRDGQMYEITWARPSIDAPLQFFRAERGAGAHYPLKPGNTFYQVIGVSSDVLEGKDFLRFMFAIP